MILGQDPYHNYNQAHGLAFSVRPPIPAPPSLKNMYIALRNDYPNGLFNPPPPSVGGLLTPWAERGVLLLNTCLTVRAHEPKSHAEKGWERLTARAIEAVEKVHSRRGVVFMAWGTPAQKVVSKVDAKKHLVLKAVHPSPLSAARGFFDCGHFKKANEWLKQRYGEDGQVDWALVPGESVLGRKKEEKKDAEGAKKLQGVVATVDEKEKAQDELEVDDVDWAALDEMNKAEAEAEKKAAKAEVDADKKEDPAKAEAEADAEKKEEEAKGEALVDVKA